MYKKIQSMIAFLLMASLILAACATPAPEVVVETVIVEKDGETIIEVVTEEVEVTRQVEVEVTSVPEVAEEPSPAFELPDLSRPYQYNATQLPATFVEAPMLAEQVAAGTLPPVNERLPLNPPVVVPYEKIGKYGGNAHSHLWDFPLWWLAARAFVHADLVRQQGGNSGTFEADLAERWDVSDDSTQWTFYLREGLKWSDGAPFTTADIMFWYENVLLNEDLMPAPAPWLSPGDEVVQIEAINDTTVRLTFAQPHPLFLLGLTQGNSHNWQNWVNHPAHYMAQYHPNFTPEDDLNAKVVEAGLGSWTDLYIKETEPHTASSGRPYLWAWTPDGPLEADGSWAFTRNPYYYKIDEEGKQLPYIDTWTISKVTDNQALILNTIAGEFDLVHTFIRGDSLPPIRDAIDGGAPLKIIQNLNAKTGEVALYMNYTVDDPVLREIFNDLRFRQAVSLAINREEVSEARFRGFSTPGQGSFPPVDPFVYDPEWNQAFAEYDPDTANQLLDEMGLTERDGDGFRLRPDGERLTIIMDYRSGNHVQAVELLPDYMRDIGIDLQLKASANVLFDELTKDNSIQWAGNSFQPSFYSLWALLPAGSEAAASRPFGVLWSQWYYSDGAQGEEPPPDMKRMMELVDLAEQAGSIEERVELIKQAGELHKKNLWVIGIAGMDLRPHIAHIDLLNIPPSPYGLNIDPASHSQYAEQWFWDR